MKHIWMGVGVAALVAACSPATDTTPAADEAPAPDMAAHDSAPSTEAMEEALAPVLLEDVLAHPRREDDRARDPYRHPAETLAFFEVEPTHAVVEALPGGGWYGRILAPYVAEAGQYMAINYPMDVYEQLFGDRLQDETFRARLEGWETSFPDQVTEWGGEAAGAFRFGGVPAEFEGAADRVLYIRALHNLARFDRLDGAAADAFALLRPGGVVGVVQHRAPADETDARADGSRGYLREADVIAAFEAAGFVLEASSDINANPADPANHEIGVWTLPPTLALGEENRDAYIAIGETDRMTLKFRKPE